MTVHEGVKANIPSKETGEGSVEGRERHAHAHAKQGGQSDWS